MTKDELKNELKNEIKNRISLALKDHILQQGFEIICKNLSELEKENKELKTRVENQKSFLERIQAKFNLGEIDRKEIEGYLESEQLTKAKELLERWLRLYNTNTVKGIITDTRQFIKESE